MSTRISISKRERRRRLKSGEVLTQLRYVVSYRQPRSGKRTQLFYERRRDAELKRNEIAAALETGTCSPQSSPPENRSAGGEVSAPFLLLAGAGGFEFEQLDNSLGVRRKSLISTDATAHFIRV